MFISTPGWSSREEMWELSVSPKNTTQCPAPGLKPGVRFSKDPKTSPARRLFGALFGWISRVPESVSQRARKHPGFSPEFFVLFPRVCRASLIVICLRTLIDTAALSWVPHVRYKSSSIKPSFVESQAHFWLFLSFVQFQHRLLYFDWSLKGIKNVRKVWCKC